MNTVDINYVVNKFNDEFIQKRVSYIDTKRFVHNKLTKVRLLYTSTVASNKNVKKTCNIHVKYSINIIA